ncbi:extra-large guanine nucleotide-binding protein 1-like isoform X2 [Salvia miltiorrhiza]|uniref:extra-large guanine nucleotide-binding protein 1-like isoform X2 n=1 Tax=Salvia miltiorrhiza TaxID=226208 RepID=UPI0025AD515F|nr:extra-large guanine nucleotide-binding protein 1-like isoform X2 [Salvia miltiorrhiza]
MTSVFRSILPDSSAKTEDVDDGDYSVEYSFAMEYSGPPVSHDIPQVVPIDIRRIPTASVAARAVMLKDFTLPVIQPVVKSDQSKKNVLGESSSGSKTAERSSKVVSSGRVYSRKLDKGSNTEVALATTDGYVRKSNELGGTQNSTDGATLPNDTSHVEGFNGEGIAVISYDKCSNAKSLEASSENSSCDGAEDCVVEPSGLGNRMSAVTFRDSPSIDSISEESDEYENANFRERPVALNDGKKGSCYKCHKRNRFAEKEICLVCGAKYCKNCLVRAMGCMPEGRKCITCIGYPIDESRRGSLGKCSGMLKKLLASDAVNQIMSSELSCEVNQLPSHLICVNGKPLSIGELVMLQSSPNPPKKLRPGKYWYDKVSGFWGKEGEKPSQIISAELNIGYRISEDASNGDTNVLINNRRITKAELWMLQAAGINCEGNIHFWLTADGSCMHEGMNNILGQLWARKRVKIVCAALSLPYPSDTSISDGVEVDKGAAEAVARNLEQKMMNKILLVGSDQSGTSTIFKQAKIVYGVPFSEDEKQSIKFVIQRNVYSYIGILLEGCARFEEDYLVEMRRQQADEPGPSDSGSVDESNIYSLNRKLKAFADWLLQTMVSGNLELIFPAATQMYSPLVEELWKDKAFQATYRRRNELHSLPRAANYFLDRAVEITQIDYEPTQMDILYAEGITTSNGVASMEFSFPKSSLDWYMDSADQNDAAIRLVQWIICKSKHTRLFLLLIASCHCRYQLIRVHLSSLGENCKWLEMFEDVDLVVLCISLTDYDEYHEDMNGVQTNKMVASKNIFESIITHPTLCDKNFLLILNKLDLLEEKIEGAPLTQCPWFQDFNPVISIQQHRPNSIGNPSLAQRAFHFIALKFKRLFTSLTDRKLFVSTGTGLEAESVDRALRYGREILKWNDEMQPVSMNESSCESITMDPSASLYS